MTKGSSRNGRTVAEPADSIKLDLQIEPDSTIPTLFSNAMLVNRVGGLIQLDFAQVDLQNMVRVIKAVQESHTPPKEPLSGTLRGRVVITAQAFMNIWPVLEQIQADLEKELDSHPGRK